MPAEKTSAAGPIQLSFRDVKQVVVEPEDENRFMMTAKEAARACEVAQNEIELRRKFVDLLTHVWTWCDSHASDVTDAYAYPGDGQLNVLLLTPGEEYNSAFDDAVTDLDLDLADKHAWLVAEVIQAPQTVKQGHSSIEKAILRRRESCSIGSIGLEETDTNPGDGE